MIADLVTGFQIAVIAVCLLCAYTAGTSAQPPETFGATKKLAAEIHEAIGHQVTIYCGCPYDRKGRSGGDLDRDTCGMTARKSEKRSDRLEWEHVVPASWIGENHSCWSEGDPLCVKSDGTRFKGRKCCTKRGVDPEFMEAHNDLHNLLPAGGELNGDRLNHPFGEVDGEARVYGECDFEVGGKPKVAEPIEGARGELARAMLYMAKRYGVNVRMPRETLMQWDENDPAEPWERERAERIEASTGQMNPYIGTP